MVFYDYIKGINSDANINTYIQFKGNEKYPVIHQGDIDDIADPSLGQILTTKGNEQTIYKNFIFNTDKYITADTINVNTINARSGNILNIPQILKHNGDITLRASNKDFLFSSDGNFSIVGNIEAKNLNIGKYTEDDPILYKTTVNGSTGDIDTKGAIGATGIISSSSYITAPYFVATSDRRAKENIVSLPPLLNYVRSIPVYSFNFRDNPSEPSIGIMAQDVESRFVGPFNLVQQPADPSSYKAIRESKLVYILWKAVQDLADEVDSLKWRLSKLEQGEGGN